MTELMSNYGLASWIYIIAFGELTSTVLFVVPKTNKLGVLLLSAHLGGAIVTHMSHGEPFVLQSFMLIAVWTSGHLRSGNVFV